MTKSKQVEIPMSAIEDDRLSSGALGLYGLICSLSQSDQLTTTTVKPLLLLRRLNISWDALRKVLIELDCAGYVDKSWYEQDCVYLIKASAVGLYKIGKAKDACHRFSVLNRSSPVALELIDAIATNNKDELEKMLHAKFAHLRTRFEWFKLSDSDVDYFAGLHK